MTRTERALRDGAKLLMEAGYNPVTLSTIWQACADKAEAKGKHDEAAEIRAAVGEFREVGNGQAK